MYVVRIFRNARGLHQARAICCSPESLPGCTSRGQQSWSPRPIRLMTIDCATSGDGQRLSTARACEKWPGAWVVRKGKVTLGGSAASHQSRRMLVPSHPAGGHQGAAPPGVISFGSGTQQSREVTWTRHWTHPHEPVGFTANWPAWLVQVNRLLGTAAREAFRAVQRTELVGRSMLVS